MTNPLIQAYRKPALYVSLPSGGNYYKEKPKLSVDGELAIYSMTARDELISKTPDALFNGEATFSLIKSCAPDIADAHDMPVNDLMVVLIAIRMASHGDTISVDIKCPTCSHLNQLGISTAGLLSTVEENKSSDHIILDNDFKVNCKPYSLADRTLLQIQRIKQAKLIEGLNNEDLSDEERQIRFGETFIEIADITVTLIANAITQVSPPEGEKVADHNMILEWLKSITKDDYDKIKNCVEDLSENNIDTKFDASCQACEHTWKTTIDLDIANFFVG